MNFPYRVPHDFMTELYEVLPEVILSEKYCINMGYFSTALELWVFEV
jgi:hypothetical protein